jgi:NAD(P)-dependent dehydrogenase (short-subunit alcohol dehydrogenase family)
MRNILVTGGTGKLGGVLVTESVKDGNKVFFTGRSVDKIKAFENTFKINAGSVAGIELNLQKIESYDDFASRLDSDVDFIVHNARSIDSLLNDKSGRVSESQFQKELFMAVTAPYILTNKLIDYGFKIKDIVFISSMYGSVAPTPSLYTDFLQQSPVNYGVAKAAQLHLVKELAVRLAPRNIRVNAISYGGVEGRADKKFMERYAELCPQGRMLRDEDIYPPLQMLIKNPNLSINGENIKVDGGWTIW